MIRKQIIQWLCLIISIQAIAFVAVRASEPAIDSIRKGLSTDMNQLANRTGVEVAVVHDRKGAYGGSDLLKKPTKTKSGASSLPVALAWITFSVCVVVSYLFLLS